MLKLPYIPQHYPDEILGSWLARIALLNGNGAWRTLIEESGYQGRIKMCLFDIPDFDLRINQLLNHLGCTYKYALLNLSTFPYWASFERSNTEFVRGTSDVKALVYNKKVLSKLVMVGQTSNQFISLTPYFCSLCLIQDFSIFGEPYWHRSHQLPTVYYCPRHNIPLQNKCPKCGVYNLSGGLKLISLPTLVCSCGYDYRLQKHEAITLNEIFKRLSEFSIKALENNDQNWCNLDVRAYFDNIIVEYFGSKNEKVYPYIKNIFKTEEISLARYSLQPPISSKLGLFRRRPSAFRAPDYCLILASLNIDFETASKSLNYSLVNTPPTPKNKNVNSIPESVELALITLANRIKNNPKNFPARHKMLYWYLRIYADDSLKSYIPDVRLRPFPTIEEDRINIQKYLTKMTIPECKKCPATVRATIRDGVWLDKVIQQNYEDLKTQSKNSLKLKNDKLIEILKQKMHEILHNENRPKWIFLNRLGTHIGFSAGQMNILSKKYPELNQEIRKINDDKKRRQLIWAVKELKKEGINLSAKKIYEKAGLPPEKTTNSIVKQLLIDN